MAAPHPPDMSWLLFSLSGRLGRKPYVLAIMFWLVALLIPVSLILQADIGSAELLTSGLLGFAMILATLWSMICLSVKRLHDIDVPGIAVFLLFIPALTLFILLALMIWPSTPAPNRFGPKSNERGH